MRKISVPIGSLMFSAACAGTPAPEPATARRPVTTASCPAQADRAPLDPSKKTDDIERLLIVMRVDKILPLIIDQYGVLVRAQVPGFPHELWDQFRKDFSFVLAKEMVVPAYERHFEHEEIRSLIAFYESPSGSKAMEKVQTMMPELMAEAGKVGQVITESRVNDWLRKHGYRVEGDQ